VIVSLRLLGSWTRAVAAAVVAAAATAAVGRGGGALVLDTFEGVDDLAFPVKTLRINSIQIIAFLTQKGPPSPLNPRFREKRGGRALIAH